MFLTVSDISASLSPSNAIGIQVTLGWFMFEPLKGPVALFDCIFANVRGIVSSAMSFKMEVKKDMGSSASAMADCCRRVLHRCWN